ncbi:hypothetical protein SORBI_3010G153800 [Sorghum bicolor]|uniref:Uncharacterized protein n=1 Tax=Sorghum bicolor TaxID=4558 RepID=A0A1W0VT99_SORBI|nr:hypothetical protein SORBI_3010G153800 [Sorghum bicolor]
MARGSRSELARRQQRDAKGKFSGPVLGRCQKPSSAAGGSSRTKTPMPSLAIGGSSRSMKVEDFPPGFGPVVTSNPNASSAVGGRTRSKTLKASPVLGASPPSQWAVDFPPRFGPSGSRNPKASAPAGGHAGGSQRQLTCPKQNIDKTCVCCKKVKEVDKMMGAKLKELEKKLGMKIFENSIKICALKNTIAEKDQIIKEMKAELDGMKNAKH